MINVPDSLKSMCVFVVDDEAPNRLLLERILNEAGFDNLVSIGDPDQVIEMMTERTPDIVILDLHMPGRGGFSLLEEIRGHHPSWNQIPILVFTADVNRETRQKALDMGANDFLAKPGDATEIALRVRNFLRTRQLYIELERHSLDLEAKVLERTADLSRATEDCLWRLARASEYRDDDTGEHTLRVGVLSAFIAGELGMSLDEVEMIRLAAPLHDIGKIGIPDNILLKRGTLNDDEMDVVQSHVKIGVGLLAGSSSKLMRLAATIAGTHHEKWDGNGYPNGVAGEDIPIVGRIVAVADVFDALTHDRPYKTAWSREEAIDEIIRLSGTHFDPRVADAFSRVVGNFAEEMLV